MQIDKANPWRLLEKDLLKHLSVLSFAKYLHAPVTFLLFQRVLKTFLVVCEHNKSLVHISYLLNFLSKTCKQLKNSPWYNAITL